MTSTTINQELEKSLSSPHLRRFKPIQVVLAVLLGMLIFIQVYPVIWLLLSSLKAPDEFSLRPMFALPETTYWKNYVDAWTAGKMSLYYRNSIMVVIPSIALTILLSTMASFALEVLKWRFNNAVLLLFLAGIMVPAQIVLLPLFTIYYTINLNNNLLGLILVYTVFGMPLTVFLMTGYLKGIPTEVFEAAVMDGANIYQVFFRVAMPMIANSIITVGLIQFFFVWNDLLLSMTFISNTRLRTIQTGLLSFVGEYGQRQWGPTFAAIAMAVIPTLLIYLLLNNLVIKGLTAGAVKG
jgi:raffinose/stachyose/melibiose transport system permease protein